MSSQVSWRRAFAPSAFTTAIVLAAMAWLGGLHAAGVTAILILIEVAFSFDNAVVNAKVLGKLSPRWRLAFLTFGMIIAVLGMRVVFPVVLVMATARLSWGSVVHLALHDPYAYAQKLDTAHPVIAAFGGAFLLMLALHFFFDKQRQVVWLPRLERPLMNASRLWQPAFVTAACVLALGAVPANHHARQTIVAGLIGLATFMLITKGAALLGRTQAGAIHGAPQVGWAAFSTFVYLEVLDASFSFDSVLGAFAVTNKVVLIVIGLGVGALWVRSLTLFMVRRQTLGSYRYLEHGAHYTILVLALLLLAGVVANVPDVIGGAAGLGIIGASVVSSRREIVQE